jgi:uncharacterized protein
MKDVLKRKELHIFNKYGKNLVFDVNDMNLFEINNLTRAILEQVEGKNPVQLTATLSDRFSAEQVSKVLDQLMKLKLVGFQLPEPGKTETSYEDCENGKESISRAILYVTQDCNLKCRYCLTQRGGNIKKKKMSEEVAQSAVDLLFRESNDARDLTIGLYGGEPLLEFNLIKRIIRYANQKAGEWDKKINYTLTTNGTLLTDEILDFLSDNKVNITLSIDGNQETHDTNRVFPDGSGSFSKTFTALSKMKEKGINISTITVVGSLKTSLKDISQALIDMGISKMVITPAVSPDGQLIIPGTDIERYNREYENMVQYLLDNDTLWQKNSPINFSTVFKFLDKKVKNKTNCNAGYGRISIDPDGNILPCDNFIGIPRYYMGNVFSEMDKAHQKTFKKIRAAYSQTCQECWARHLCGGWCPYFSHNRNNEPGQPVDMFCKFGKNYFEIALSIYSHYKKKQKMSPKNKNQEKEYVN